MEKADEVFSSLDNDILGFLYMSDKDDIEFMAKPDNERSNEDYLRLCTIALAFELKGAFLRIIKEAEDNDRVDEIIESMDKYEKKYPVVKKWIDDFISHIKDKKLKDLVKKSWSEKTAKIEKEGFSFSKLI